MDRTYIQNSCQFIFRMSFCSSVLNKIFGGKHLFPCNHKSFCRHIFCSNGEIYIFLVAKFKFLEVSSGYLTKFTWTSFCFLTSFFISKNGLAPCSDSECLGELFQYAGFSAGASFFSNSPLVLAS